MNKSPSQPSPKRRTSRKAKAKNTKYLERMKMINNNGLTNHPSFGGAGGRLFYV